MKSCKGWAAVLGFIAVLWGPISTLGAETDANPGPENRATADKSRVVFQNSWPIDAEVTAMAMGDLTGDGRNELVLAAGIDIHVYALHQGRLKPLARHKSFDRYRFIALDVADMDGDGRAEVYASRFNEGMTAPSSMVFELKDGELHPLVKNSEWFFRVMHWPGKGEILVGQHKGRPGDVGGGGVIRDFFERRIYRLAWQGSSLAPDKGPLADLSRGSRKSVYIYNFALGDVTGDGAPEMAVIDREGRLNIMDIQGNLLAWTDAAYGGAAGYIWTNPGWDDSKSRSIRQQYLYIPPRVLIRDLNGDGTNEIIAGRNSSSGMASRFRSFITDGGIEAFSWKGAGLVADWETAPMGGSLSDYTIKDLDNDGSDELVAVMLQKRKSGLFEKGRSLVVSYPLNP
ncbi:MAG: VCBS repeat-containing protein [Deltaproteobacteria bacterium]|nr:VCBS repeat-containing protein [Deltaproteobacteria bacterium]